ncbi:ThuA domain-containing protein [Autumnicola musiva]|uniref:ThuA domain-containing protein n=1 Tax=Autumnicola musiva TaxID=3075589 RepID=A0ABU3D185_9FLAO|nr:ThuA domain-containing protein [Zunongwangia sp. F117]MDT0675298.1 ThuA domain-containing protein [Zunongwangia sp. F117]
MKILYSLFIAVFLISFSIVAQEKQVLVFSETQGFRHSSIPTGIKTIQELGDENGFKVDTTENSATFLKDIQKYNVIIFLNTTGDVFTENEQEAFQKYIESGGSFFGIHAATDTEYDWQWYGELAGAYFVSHPQIQNAEIHVEMPSHPTVEHLPEVWQREDEWYNFKQLNPENEVLLSLDETSYKGGENGNFHPIAWFRELDSGGRVIYTGGGHTKESYANPAFRQHLLKSILFAMGK